MAKPEEQNVELPNDPISTAKQNDLENLLQSIIQTKRNPMATVKSRYNQVFNSRIENEIDYIAGLYPDRQRVYNFLKSRSGNGAFRNMKYRDVFALIQTELWYPIPLQAFCTTETSEVVL